MTRYRLHHGNCLEYLEKLKPASCGAAIIDPPYASGSATVKLRGMTPDKKYTQGGQKARWIDFEGDQLDNRSWRRFAIDWLQLVKRAVKPGRFVLIFIDWRQLPLLTDAVQIAGLRWQSLAVWDKGEGTRPFLGRFRHQCEYLVVASTGNLPSGQDAIFKGVLPGCFKVPVIQGDKHHLTGKPTELLRRLVTVCPKGETVLDCFAGSGTTGVASLLEGRHFTGCELSAEYHSIACARLDAAARGVIVPSRGPNATTLTPPPTNIVPKPVKSLAERPSRVGHPPRGYLGPSLSW